MKKIFVTVICIALYKFSFSQIDKGYWLVGGNAGFESYNSTYTTSLNNTSSKQTNISFSPKIGYFFVKKIAAGLNPKFTYGHYNPTGSSTAVSSSSYSFGIGPFFRYYFLNDEKQYNILFDANYTIGKIVSPNDTKITGKNNEVSLLIGPEIYFNSSAAIEILLGYKNSIQSLDNPNLVFTEKRNGLFMSIGFILHLIKEN